LEEKNSGMVMAWPIPMSRSRVRTSPAMVIDSEAKNDEPSITAAIAPSRRSGCQWNRTPSSDAMIRTTTTVALPDELDPVEDRDEQRRLGDDPGRQVVEVGKLGRGRDGVDPGEGLAEDQQPRPADQGLGQLQAADHPPE
jgi:hypothetical protein